ncbi:MAG TPA: hypothetical protein VKN18_14920 [Blastocatellia bacterium]|nr:hypothetical protein [Blastocatellia bacterium]
MFTFGKIPTYQSNDKFDLAVSDDKRALTLTFSDLQVTVGGSKSPAPMSTRVFSLVVPLEGKDERVEIEFGVSAFIKTLDGATATIVSSVNGQSTVADFPANSEQSLVQQLKFTGQSPSECRLCVVLLVGRDTKNSNAEAFLNVTAIDAEILPRAR